ncbi:MAG: DeoR/GlpR family DNA-binding transcription regulator [Candidatus Marinimicrobia bacterium]|nr:DeoR/GlpR family DNA-binding transcription regulator [Candidatus Neomarinimicrobiota bacterium]
MMIANSTFQQAADAGALAVERQAQIMAWAQARRVVRVEELCRGLGVSAATARRDLAELEAHGLLRRVHGGAMLPEGHFIEPLFDDKTALAAAEKRAIAAAAHQLIVAGSTVYLDGGSTLVELARLLAEGPGNLTVVTNSLRAANELAGRGPRLYLVAGELRRRSQTLVGPLSRCLLEQLRFDLAFLGTIGLDARGCMSTTDAGEAFTKALVLERAQRTILLADHSKLGQTAFAAAGRLRPGDQLITDAAAPAAFLRALRRQRVKTTLVPPPSPAANGTSIRKKANQE